MGFNFETGQFTGANFKLNPAQVVQEIADMAPGDIAFADFDELWSDHERNMWVNRNSQLIDEEELEDFIEDGNKVVRVICANRGIIIDASHYEQYDYHDVASRFAKFSVKCMEEGEDVDAMPVIYYAANPDELLLIENALLQNNIDLAATRIADLVDLEIALIGDDPLDEESPEDD